MKVVLSIKPEFANKIFDGTKKFEFRKSIFKNEKIKTVIVYSSSPVQQVIGEFDIDEVLNHDLLTLWDLTQKHSGISEEFYYDYFANKQQGFAIKIKRTRKTIFERFLINAMYIHFCIFFFFFKKKF